MIVAAKLVFLVIWIGAATSKTQPALPFVIHDDKLNNPLFRRGSSSGCFSQFPATLRPAVVADCCPRPLSMCKSVLLNMRTAAGRRWRTRSRSATWGRAIPIKALEWNVRDLRRPSLPVGHACLGLADVVKSWCRWRSWTPLSIVIVGNVSPARFVSSRHVITPATGIPRCGASASAEDKINWGIVASPDAGRSAERSTAPSPDPDVCLGYVFVR